MPIVRLDLRKLQAEIGVDASKLISIIPLMGAGLERMEHEYIDVEFFPNRPDLYSIQGVIRALKSFLGMDPGYKQYPVQDSGIKLIVHESVLPIRPYIISGLVREVHLDESDFHSIIQLQENLHWTLGRNRRKLAIGLHDFSKIHPPLHYRAVDGCTQFQPLGMHAEMSISQICSHPKFRRYASYLGDRYPVVMDSRGIIALPPVINSERTRLAPGNRDVFIDITGTDLRAMNSCLNILATAMAEIGGKIFSIEIIHPHGSWKTPELSPRWMKIHPEEVNRLLGLDLTPDQMISLLERMMYGAEMEGSEIRVKIPAYRSDILHPWDVIEDIAISYGYDKLIPKPISISRPGNPSKQALKIKLIRQIMLGLGFSEVIGYTLSNPQIQYHKMLIQPDPDAVMISNPVSSEHTMIRRWILPGLLEILSRNRDQQLPQRIFEIGHVIHGCRTEIKLGCITLHSKAGFSEIWGAMDALLREMEIRYQLIPEDNPFFIQGRSSGIYSDGSKLGILGEIHPHVLLNFNLDYPAAGFEIEID